MAGVWERLQKVGGRWSQSGSAGAAGDPEVQEQLLRDPAVLDAVRGAGLRALSDPAVQRAVLNVAAEKAPEVAGQAAAMVKAWASDPEVQARAKYMAGMAAHYTGHAGEAAVHCIEQGPEGVQVLAFVGGGASLVLAGLQALNPLAVVGATFTYVISLYQVLFSLTTMLFEAKTEWISQYEIISDLHDMLMLNLRFLSLSLGRGLFYIFQGSIWWVLSSFFGIPQKLLALYMCFLGTLYILMHFGVMPQHVATKMKGAFAEGADYIRVTN
eukprot:CAMPEP_0179126912 /NCGR_PEP_ID=MMETSP0796-20121207/60095_1 /TAXON_ID=73915 /ORGANISM="Pyrodinium bahamense, Strain pbaha01" /LENGTH=269 /DNA_ID=CAMNT_0020825679 /DNA_START=104 /DNA_END=913 /DNA_ORIENTATION=+